MKKERNKGLHSPFLRNIGMHQVSKVNEQCEKCRDGVSNPLFLLFSRSAIPTSHLNQRNDFPLVSSNIRSKYLNSYHGRNGRDVFLHKLAARTKSSIYTHTLLLTSPQIAQHELNTRMW